MITHNAVTDELRREIALKANVEDMLKLLDVKAGYVFESSLTLNCAFLWIAIARRNTVCFVSVHLFNLHCVRRPNRVRMLDAHATLCT